MVMQPNEVLLCICERNKSVKDAGYLGMHSIIQDMRQINNSLDIKIKGNS
jgi:hypothetical protein